MIGGSGCGKTNLLLNLIYDLLPWSRLYVYAKDLNEEKYCEKVLNRLMMTFNSLLTLEIFDDFVCDKPSFDSISELFITGRQKN
jgi:ABC-type transporter Mla maintaining outer membrane lipid asymmetry ATPase subunit MlaF